MSTSSLRRSGLVAVVLAVSWAGGPAAGQQTSSPSRLRDHKVLKGDLDVIWSLSFAPDGRTLAVGLGDRTVRVWDVIEGKELAVLRGHKEAVRSVAFSPDGRLIASGSLDGTVKFWSWAVEERGGVLATLEGHQRGVLSVAFSPDGKLLASGSMDGTVKLWDVADRKVKTNLDLGTIPLCLPPVPRRAGAVAFSPNGRMLGAVASDEGRLWDVKSGKLLITLNPFRDLRFGRRPGSIGADSIGGEEDCRATAAFTPQGKHFVTTWVPEARTDRSPLKLWDTATGQPRNLLRIRQVAFPLPDPVRIGPPVIDTRGSDIITTFALSPDGKRVATCGFEIPFTGKEKTSDEVHKVENEFSSKHNFLLVKLWDATRGNCLCRLKSHEGAPVPRIHAAAFSPRSDLLATGGTVEGSGLIRVWVVARALEEKGK